MAGLVVGLIYLVLLVIWVWALIEILKSSFKDSINKVIWLLVVFFLPVLGFILYFAIGRAQRITN
ncbi:MAG: hypothetical protein FP820_04835 [Sulfurimonas sp.]|nr:hypothetical protein [Sulfurimonas sp.]MBU3938901.1 PLDc N-terminal domain-containing protein [bacterium]MBU4024518.1 PLDc N-terminal domain-containing protein [bacterium]MBU4059112.1 PLDc N-terminal domain-containing protein [bacterium]MBU4111116.1 PLDc N-terminal domain-containing protein [bacterium]